MCFRAPNYQLRSAKLQHKYKIIIIYFSARWCLNCKHGNCIIASSRVELHACWWMNPKTVGIPLFNSIKARFDCNCETVARDWWKIDRNRLNVEWMNGRTSSSWLNSYRQIVHSPGQICGWLRELARAIPLELIARPISRRYSINERLSIWYFWKNEEEKDTSNEYNGETGSKRSFFILPALMLSVIRKWVENPI